jgi:hypothetical protein
MMKMLSAMVASITVAVLLVPGCVPGLGMRSYTTYEANYSISLSRVERPEKASQRYGPQQIDVVTGNPKYKFFFEDSLVRVLWLPGSRQILFSLENKTDHSIRVPWDEAAYVDENGRSHRVMHSGIKYADREQSIPPSIVVRRGSVDDLIFPTDYVHWQSGGAFGSSNWEEDHLFVDYDYHGSYLKGTFATFGEFDRAVKANLAKTYQVLLPLQIEEVVNDYIFTFKVDSVSTFQKNGQY